MPVLAWQLETGNWQLVGTQAMKSERNWLRGEWSKGYLLTPDKTAL